MPSRKCRGPQLALHDTPTSKRTASTMRRFTTAWRSEGRGFGNSGSGRRKDQASTSKLELFLTEPAFSVHKTQSDNFPKSPG